MSQTAESTQTPWLTVAGVSQRAHVGKTLIFTAIKSGHLRAVRIGGRREVRVRMEWVDEWLQRQEEGKPS